MKKRKDSVLLVELARGEEGMIIDIDTTDQARLKKLLAMGVLPGQDLKLIQRYPVFVIKIGQTQLAVDEKLAERIWVSRNKGFILTK